MSIGTAGPSGGLPQGLAALLAQLSPAQSSAGVAAKRNSDFDGSSLTASKSEVASSTNALTGGGKAAISDAVLALLTKLQQNKDSDGGTTAAPGSAHTSSANASQFSTANRAFQNANSALNAADLGPLSVLTSRIESGQTAALLGCNASLIA
jgi:hypothetical protein